MPSPDDELDKLDELDEEDQDPDQPPSPTTPASVWSGMKSYLGVGDQADVSQSDLLQKPMAYTRITRTPIYQDPNLPKNVGGRYYPASSSVPTPSIALPPDELQKHSDRVLPHESSHAIYEQGKLTPAQVGSAPLRAWQQIRQYPDLYPPLPEHASSAQVAADQKMQADEGLAYSVGQPDATPFIERVAGQMQDRKTAERLLRLHQNAVQTAQTRLRQENAQKPAFAFEHKVGHGFAPNIKYRRKGE